MVFVKLTLKGFQKKKRFSKHKLHLFKIFKKIQKKRKKEHQPKFSELFTRRREEDSLLDCVQLGPVEWTRHEIAI